MTLDPATKINLDGANVLLVEQSQHGLDVLMQTLLGFGVRNCLKATRIEDAVSLAERKTLDLAIIDPNLPETDGHEMIEWLRRTGEPNRCIPIIVISANSSRAAVERARDSGANYFVVKPLTPSVLLDRIYRLSREARDFIVSESYVGPDRRFKHEGPPPGVAPRRSTDIRGQLGEAKQPNLSQAQIDSMFKPQKIDL